MDSVWFVIPPVLRVMDPEQHLVQLVRQIKPCKTDLVFHVTPLALHVQTLGRLIVHLVIRTTGNI